MVAMSIVWKRLRKAPESSREDLYGDLNDRLRARAEDAGAGVLDMLYELRHPLVRAAMKTSRRRRAIAGACFAGVPALVFLAAVVLAVDSATAPAAGWLVGIYACFWPLVAFIGVSLDAGAAVVSEREGHTAAQLVLTPVPKRPIAASKILPAVFPYLVGMLGALPVLILAGSTHPFFFRQSLPTPLVLWPLRLAAPFFGCGQITPSVPGFLTGLLMWFTDGITVWAAAHWGAAYGVRLGRTPLVALAMAWRLLATLVYLALALAVTCATGLIVFLTAGSILGLFSPVLAVIVVSAGALWVFIALWRRYYLGGPVRVVLTEFTYFDSLARDDFEPRPLRGWSLLLPYGERT